MPAHHSIQLHTMMPLRLKKVRFLLVWGCCFLPLVLAAQKDEKNAAVKLLVDQLKFVTDVPYICRDTVYGKSVGCGDSLFWKIVMQKRDAIPFLMDKLDDTTQTIVPVPNFGGNYTVADIAYVAMREIIDNIPTFWLLGLGENSYAYGTMEYWEYIRADIRHRRKFQREIRKWEKTLGGRWIEDKRVLTCDCAFPHPSGGHYIREYTLSNYNGWGVHVEYSYLKAHSIGFGINLISESFQPFIGKRKINYTVDGTITGLFFNHTSAFGQRIDVGVNVQKTSPDFHVFVEHNDRNDFRIGGKVGVSFGNFIYLHYRYSYPLTSYENPYISRHGVVLTIKLNMTPIGNAFGM